MKCERARIPLFSGLFCIVEDDDKEIGASFGSPGGGVRDGVDAERFSSAMVAMVEGEGEGQGTKKTFNEFFNELARLKENLDSSAIPFRCRVPSAKSRLTVTESCVCWSLSVSPLHRYTAIS